MFRGFPVLPDGCDHCPLQGSVRVPGEGNPQATIAIVGMGPGYYETKLGRPFVGNSGQLLDRMLDTVGLQRSELWISNVGCCQPLPVELAHGAVIPKGRVEKDSMLKHCRGRILRELGLIKPKVVVALGTLTAEALCDDVKGVTQLHGSLCRLSHEVGHAAIVIPLFHPAHLLRGEQRFYPAVLAGLRKAKRLAEGVRHPLGQLLLIDPCVPRVNEKLDLLEKIVDEAIAYGEDVAVDFETTSEKQLDAALTVFGFAVGPRATRGPIGIAVTVRSWNNGTGTFEWLWSRAQWERLLPILRRLWRSKNCKLFWNWGFDVTIGERFFGPVGGTVRDGMILHHLDYPDLLHRLDFAVQTELDVEPWKFIYRDKVKRGVATQEDLLIYNAQDALYTLLVLPKVEQNARLRGNLHLERRQLEVSCLARRAHIDGIPVNPRAWQRVYDEHRKIHDDALITMRGAIAESEGAAQAFSVYVDNCRRLRSPGKAIESSILGVDDWNPRSGDHGRWFLYEFLKLQPQRWTKGGPEKDPTKILPSASYKGVLVFTDRTLVKAYVDCAEEEATLRTLESIRANVNPRTGRLHPSWQTTSMKGTRWTSGGGVNVQNWDEILKQVTSLILDEEEGPPSCWWVAADACLAEGTLVETTNGKRPIQDLRVGDKVYTLRGRRVAWGAITASACTGSKPVYAVTFDNGAVVECTADHRWPVRERNPATGYWDVVVKRTDQLSTGTRMIPCKRVAASCNTHYNLYAYSCREYTIEHRLIGEAEFGPLTGDVHIHHRDRDGFNNALDNLCPVSSHDHLVQHLRDRWSAYTATEHRRRVQQLGRSASIHHKQAYVGEGNPNYRGGKIIVACLYCGKPMRPRFPSAAKSYKYCSRRCYYEARRNGLNTKVVSVVYAGEKRTYNITVEPDHNFALAAGVFTMNSAIEYRVAAWLANIPELLTLFNGETFDEEKEEWKKYDPRFDAHSLVAVEVFGDLFTKGSLKLKKSLRTMVKRVVYALFYGAFPEKIFQTILEDKRVPTEFRAFVVKHRDLIDRVYTGFNSRFSEWERFAQRQIAQVRFHDEQIIQPFGRHRPWALSAMVEETKLRNTPIQLSAGEIVNDVFLATDKEIRKQGLRATFAVHEHDSEKWVVHAADVMKVKDLMNEEFDRWLEFGDDEDEPRRRIHIYGQSKVGSSLAGV